MLLSPIGENCPGLRDCIKPDITIMSDLMGLGESLDL